MEKRDLKKLNLEKMSIDQSWIEVKKFGGKGFKLWKLKMEAPLVDRDLWHMIRDDTSKENTKEESKEDKSTDSTSTELEEWNSSDRRVQSLIWLCLACRNLPLEGRPKSRFRGNFQ